MKIDAPGAPIGATTTTRHESISQGIYEQILQVAADAIVTVDADQRIVQFNRGAEIMFGYTEADVMGSSLGVLLPPRFRARHSEDVSTFGQSATGARLMGQRREVFGLRKDGSEFPAEASILKLDAPDGRRLYAAVVRDVTDRKRTHQQQRFLAEVSATLSQSLEYVDTLESVARLPVPALADACILDVLDESGKLRRLAHSREDFEGLRTLRGQFVLASDGMAMQVNALVSGFTQVVADVTGEWLDAHCSDPAEADLIRRVGVTTVMIVPLVARAESIGVMTLLGIGPSRSYDASDVVIAENFAGRAALAIVNARLYRAAQHATRARDEVLGVVSHDLRNPLSAIAMCSRVLVDSPPATAADRRELATNIYDSTTWMSRMIQDLLDVSTIEAGVLSIVRANEKVELILRRASDLFTRAAAERKVGIVVQVDDAALSVHADSERLMQAVANLISNALKFTPSGGSVAVTACALGGDVEIAVTDTGRGIAEQDLSHIFDRYWHSHGSQAGAGLGLAIAKGIVEAHGGRIVVASTLGAGSRFALLLPLTVQGRAEAT
ncbi:MAG TPA: ATP-binding protein [Gemmatimonadaceae bacterium]|nr:ATP-binding protein [Gemmatimonadaceae bacterium]